MLEQISGKTRGFYNARANFRQTRGFPSARANFRPNKEFPHARANIRPGEGAMPVLGQIPGLISG